MRRVLIVWLAVLWAIVSAIGCGGSSHTVTVTHTAAAPTPATSGPALPAPVKTQAQVPCPPPAGEAFMGACAPKPVQVYRQGAVGPLVTAALAGGKFPDVSSWQGSVNWNAVKAWEQQHGWKPAGIFKMGEYGIDPWAATNNARLKAAGMFRAGYWFIRNTGCAHEAQQMIDEARALGLRMVVEDDEVPEAAGYDGCLTPRLKAAGFTVVEYASPGAYPGGSHTGNPAWIAAYGPAFPPAAPWGGRIVAFQCTDGVFGCVTSVPGIGADDVNIDYGITSLGAPPPDPYAKYPKPARTFHVRGGIVRASEYKTVKTWDRATCHPPPRRPVCVSSDDHLRLLLARITFLAFHVPTAHGWRAVSKPRWSSDELGARAAGIRGRLP